ncbi:hypothetical protein [Ruminococcus sp.]|uniref:hypothetical protein n=1 Tax=Ruminococcus sp. TaxID=41978 RepID=UPI0025E1BCEC|nr:hypothetical protein [Ruminococcus sp.]MBQ8967275.1 hypothetical protein [Ruminococcus sp.]
MYSLYDRIMANDFLSVCDELDPSEYKIESFRHMKRFLISEETSDAARKLLTKTSAMIRNDPEHARDILEKSCKVIITGH